MKKTKSDLDKFVELMMIFKQEIFKEIDDYDHTLIRLEKHHNSVPMFYFNEDGKFIKVDTAIANDECNVCKSWIYKYSE